MPHDLRRTLLPYFCCCCCCCCCCLAAPRSHLCVSRHTILLHPLVLQRLLRRCTRLGVAVKHPADAVLGRLCSITKARGGRAAGLGWGLGVVVRHPADAVLYQLCSMIAGSRHSEKRSMRWVFAGLGWGLGVVIKHPADTVLGRLCSITTARGVGSRCRLRLGVSGCSQASCRRSPWPALAVQ